MPAAAGCGTAISSWEKRLEECVIKWCKIKWTEIKRNVRDFSQQQLQQQIVSGSSCQLLGESCLDFGIRFLFGTWNVLGHIIFCNDIEGTNHGDELQNESSLYSFMAWKGVLSGTYQFGNRAEKCCFKNMITAWLLPIKILIPVGVCQWESFTVLKSIYVNERLIDLS